MAAGILLCRGKKLLGVVELTIGKCFSQIETCFGVTSILKILVVSSLAKRLFT